MITNNIYKFNKDGAVIISPQLPEEISDYIIMYRLIAEDGMVLKNDSIEGEFTVIDVDYTSDWYEVENPKEISEEDISPEGSLYQEFLASRGIPTA